MTARTTISLPDNLKRRMDGAGEAVNWSSIAAAAFEAKLAEIASRKKEKSMSDVIQRLRGSRLEEASEDAAAGSRAGREWAGGHAAWKELQRLSEREDPEEWLDGQYARIQFMRTIDPGQFEGVRTDGLPSELRHQVNEFWQTWAGTPDASNEFVLGFANGALEVFRDVEDKI